MNKRNITHTYFKTSENALIDYISLFPEPAHLKDPSSKKYLHSNTPNLKVYGIEQTQDIVGLTVHDLNEFMRPYWGKGFVDKIDNMDNFVIKQTQTIEDVNRIFLDKFGLIHVQNMIKMPVYIGNSHSLAVMTTSFDLTNKTSCFKIFDQYKKIYKRKRHACEYFMKHINIQPFFRDILSEKEIICLLYMARNKAHKYLASEMNISPKTVETHINHIHNKLKSKSLQEIISLLRNINDE